MGLTDFSKIPNGIAALGDRLNLLYSYGVVTNKISINKFVDIVSTMPAKLFKLYPQKGTIAVGSDADIVIFNPDTIKTINAKTQHHNVDYTPFENFKLHGIVESVLVRGKFAVKNQKWVGEHGKGRFLVRN